jgi:serine/threonine kinase PknH
MMEPIPKPSAEALGISQAFDAVIAGGMAKTPIERYPSAGALAEAAHAALSSPERERAVTILRRSDTSSQPNPTAQAPAAPYDPVTSSGPSTELASPALSVSTPPVDDTDQGGPPSPPSQQPGGPAPVEPVPPRKRNRWPIVAAAAVVVVIAFLSVSIWLMMKPSGQQPPKVSAGKPPPPSTAASSDAQARLLNLLPSGYPAGVCTPATPESGSIWVNAVAMVSCGQNTKPGGPSHATYGLFPTADGLKTAFTDDIANVSLVNCPGEGGSPASWHNDRTPDATAGQIACGNYNNTPNVIWTFDAKLMLSDVYGDPATVADLHTWWDAYS